MTDPASMTVTSPAARSRARWCLMARIIVDAVTDPDSISGRAEAYAPAVDHALRLIVDRQ